MKLVPIDQSTEGSGLSLDPGKNLKKGGTAAAPSAPTKDSDLKDCAQLISACEKRLNGTSDEHEAAFLALFRLLNPAQPHPALGIARRVLCDSPGEAAAAAPAPPTPATLSEADVKRIVKEELNSVDFDERIKKSMREVLAEKPN